MPVDFDAHVLKPCEDVFGEPVKFMPRSQRGVSYLMAGIFDEGHHDLQLLDGDAPPVNVNQPVLGIRAKLFTDAGAPTPQQNDKFWISSNARTYMVKDVQPDEHGNLKVLLNIGKGC